MRCYCTNVNATCCLCDALTTIMCYSSLQVNCFDLNGDLNSCFRKKLLLYNFEVSLPNCPTSRCRCLTIHIHRVVVHHANSVYIIEGRCLFLNKLNMVFHANSFALLLCVCPRRLNRVSSRTKRIGKEETEYHKSFSFDLKDIIDYQMKPFRILLCRS